jgi:hypothetical protein
MLVNLDLTDTQTRLLLAYKQMQLPLKLLIFSLDDRQIGFLLRNLFTGFFSDKSNPNP